MSQSTAARNTALGIVAVMMVVMTALSGCTFDDAIGAGAAPDAKLTADGTSRFVGEPFYFDASASSDPNGKIVRYVFDFGDGQEATIDPSEGGGEGNATGDNGTAGNASAQKDGEAAVEHAYESPGEYTVTLTVTDDGRRQGKAETATAELVVAVNERGNLSAVVAKDPLGLAGSDRATHGVDAGPGADAINGTFDLTSAALFGDSTILVRLLSSDGEALVEESVTIPAGGEATVLIESMLPGPGNLTFEFVAESGAADVTGVYAVLYDAPIGSAPDDAPPSGPPQNVTRAPGRGR